LAIDTQLRKFLVLQKLEREFLHNLVGKFLASFFSAGTQPGVNLVENSVSHRKLGFVLKSEVE